MKHTWERRKIDPLRAIKRSGLIGCSVVCGILELFALQRSRLISRRSRNPADSHR